jgi:hypothetical protein
VNQESGDRNFGQSANFAGLKKFTAEAPKIAQSFAEKKNSAFSLRLGGKNKPLPVQ